MGAVKKSTIKVHNKKKNGILKHKFNKQTRAYNGHHYPPLLSQSFPPFEMRARPPFPPVRLPPPGMRPLPPRMRMPPPPPLFRARGPPPPRMGPRGMPPMPLRQRPPLMGPPPLMRPPPPMMGPRRFPPAPNMIPPLNKMRQLKNKINVNKKQKKKNPQNHIDLSSPWVTPSIKTEYDNKDKFYLVAKTSNKTEDWDKFKEQRAKCDKMYKAAKMEYIGRHPEENYEETNSTEYFENDLEQYSDPENETNEDSDYFCEACDRSFFSSAQLKRHLDEHRECGIDGCKFTAHYKIVEKHINMQHVTGLYYRIAQLNTPEDIAKWIAERKKRYPTKENIERKQKEQEEKINRGERIMEPRDRFGRRIRRDKSNKNDSRQKHRNNRSKTRKNKLTHLKKDPPKPKKSLPTSLLDDKSSWNGNLPPFQGTSELYNSENEEKEESKFDDSEWLGEEKCTAQKIEINNALGALIGAYLSSDDSENELNNKPEEIKIVKENPNTHLQLLDKSNPEVKLNKTIPRRGKRKAATENIKIPRKITLLERLLAPEIKHERNLILQCVRYVVENNFFDKPKCGSDEISGKDECDVVVKCLENDNKICDNELNVN